jgi:hypothetical protein
MTVPQKRRLTELSGSSRETIASLQVHAELGERLLGLAERARLLETEREKVTYH